MGMFRNFSSRFKFYINCLRRCCIYSTFDCMKLCDFIKKETLPQVLSCEFCEISKNTFFTGHLWPTVFWTKNISTCYLTKASFIWLILAQLDIFNILKLNWFCRITKGKFHSISSKISNKKKIISLVRDYFLKNSQPLATLKYCHNQNN